MTNFSARSSYASSVRTKPMRLGYISIDSPLARAALKKRADDDFEVELPGGRRHFAVLAVNYIRRQRRIDRSRG